MRASQFHLATTKETPAEAEIVSHRLMLRSGMIRKLGSGIYTWAPLGWRVLKKVEAIVREEMDRAGCLEMLMPAIQPAEFWVETGRWDDFGPLLLKMADRGGREYCFGPTHEEVITDFARAELRSYKQLPVCFYQIQTKFRDEIRPRFGVMRAREFLMKDAYSFHLDAESLDETYRVMHRAYSRTFERMGLQFRAVRADSGAIGGEASHEFQVLADSGEDAIAFSDASDYAANIELAEGIPDTDERPAPQAKLEKAATPTERTIEAVTDKLGVPKRACLKTLLVETADGRIFALCLRGDHSLNELKVSKLEPFRDGFELASEEAIRAALDCPPGFVGPVDLPADIKVIADRSAARLADFVCGANADGFHLTGANWERDAAIDRVEDIRNVESGDPSPDGQGTLSVARGIEVGHIFKLGDKYSRSMQASVLNEDGKSIDLIMGCYGIGVSRIVAAAIEQNHDDRGIIWPGAIAPFQVALLPMNAHKSHRVRETADDIHARLEEAGFEVWYDDRGVRPGVMFADSDLIGIPHRLVIGEKGIDANQVEYRARTAEQTEWLPLDRIVEELRASMG